MLYSFINSKPQIIFKVSFNLIAIEKQNIVTFLKVNVISSPKTYTPDFNIKLKN